MKFFMILLFTLISNIAYSKEIINIYSKYAVSDTGHRQLTFFVSQLNKISDKYEFRVNIILGAFGEASVRRTIVDARSNSKVMLFTTVDTLTINKELENSDKNFVYDKSVDLIPVQGLWSTSHGLVSSLDVNNIDELVDNLKKQKIFYYGYTSNSAVPKIAADSFVKHYNFVNAVPIVFKTQAEIQLSLISKEISFAVGTPEPFIASGDAKLLLSTNKDKSIFYPDVPIGVEKGIENFKYNAQTFFAIPKELNDFSKEMHPLLEKVCNSSEFYESLIASKRIRSCLNKDELEKFIKAERKWFLDNK